MKLSKRTSGHFILFIALGIIIGSLCWELLERVIALSGRNLNLAVGPVGFNVDVLEVWIKINPGSFIGFLGTFFLFRGI